jgi:predicted  nucleic acid-binding Zn-ribbon protein
MSDSQAYEEVTISSDGVAVVKRFEEDEFPVPAIAFEFESSRDESVTITMSDTVPDGIEVEDLGFHPEYGSEYWTIDDDTITFERDIEAEASYTTVYGIRATGSDNVQQFLTEPAIESVDPPLPEDEQDAGDVIPETDDDVVKDAIAGDGEIPGLEEEDEGEEGDEEDVATLELNDPNEAESAASDEGGEPAENGDASVAVEAENLTAALAAEIRQKNVSGEDLKLLRRALDVAAQEDGGGSTQARIAQIQDDISDLRAYTSALEEFLDQNGTGDQMIEDFEEELSAFDQRLESVQSELESNSEEVSAVSEEVSAVSEEVSAVSETVSTVDSEIDSLSGEIDDVSDDVDSVETDVENVSSDLDEMDSTVDKLDSSLGEIEESVSELEEQITDGEVAERVDEIEEQIDDLQTWQEQIKQTFGG